MWPTGRALPSITTPRLLALTWIGYLAGAVGGVLLVRSTPWPLAAPAALLVIAVFIGGTRAHSAHFNYLAQRNNRNLKRYATAIGLDYSDASMIRCTVL
jgi:hypothetical protein